MVILFLILQSFPIFNGISRTNNQTLLFDLKEDSGTNDIASSRSKRTSEWTLTSYLDFNNGTMVNTTIIGSNNNAELRLNFSGINQWLEKKTSISPDARCAHALASIYLDDKILLFGGATATWYESRNDTWVYDLSQNTWTNMNPSTGPGIRSNHAMATVFGDDKIILFSGAKWVPNHLIYYNETWEYELKNNTWTLINITGLEPDARHSHAMASIWGDDKIVLFGGIFGEIYNINKIKSYNDTWIYDPSKCSWTNKTPAIKPLNYPNSRHGHGMASIHNSDKVLLFGGSDENKLFNDTWIYDVSENNWTNKTPLTSPTPRSGFALTSIPGDDKVILYGGWDEVNRIYNDTWIYDLSQNSWTKINPDNFTKQPGGGYGLDMASFYRSDYILLFGGIENYSKFDYYNETWIYKHNLSAINGTYISNPYDTYANSSFKILSWNVKVPNNTSIEFQLRTAKYKSNLYNKDFIGPDGKTTTYYNLSPTNIWIGHHGQRWIQFKAYLNSSFCKISPSLKNVTISYNCLPESIIISPVNGSTLNTSKPTFIWVFKDIDSDKQNEFQLLIDDEIEFLSIDYNSNAQNSNNNYWQFPNGTSYLELPDGKYYWKIRTKDSDGDWGLYSTPFKFIIDTGMPSTEIFIPKNNTYYRKLEIIYGTAFEPPNGTGLKKVEIQIENLNANLFWNGSAFSSQKCWLIPNGNEIWSYDASKIEWTSGTTYKIRSRAVDNAGNIETPAQSKIFTFDNKEVIFSRQIPEIYQISNQEEVQVGITISDNTSGVNASTIKYSTSTNADTTWSSWKSVDGFQNGNNVDVRFNLTFPNGTGNRIRWRAYDIAGNGPTYSDEYAINVNIPKPPVTPEVKLISPANNSKLITTTVELSWEVIENYHSNIVFDIKMGIQNPPTEILKQNQPDTALTIDNLENGKTYYWTVTPRLNNINGTCISGVWSFTVDIPLPRAILKTPENNSEITSTLPTLVWSLDYEGTDTVTYDIYFGTNKDLPLKQENLTTTYFAIDTALQDNTTYYWKIVPWIGKYEGFSSEIWSFTVNLKDDKIPEFGIELILNPNPLEIKPGEVKFVSAIVTNLGELTDNFTVTISDINNTKLTAENYRQDTLEIKPGKNKEFLIMISIKDGTEPGFENITITAKSNLAEKYNLHIQDSQMLSIKILKKDIQKERGQPISIFYFSIMLLIIILIIISIIILIIVRKKSSKKDSGEENQEILPKTSTESIVIPEPTLELVPPMPVPVLVQQPEDIQTTQQDEQEE